VLSAAVRAEPPSSSPSEEVESFANKAAEVARYIQANFYDPQRHLYLHEKGGRQAEDMWGNGVMFPALVAAARHDPKIYLPILDQFYRSLDSYWDPAGLVAGYEPSQTLGVHDRYYDDNAWMAIALTEAYQLTQDERYLKRADQTLCFVLSGWDPQLGGGIWWHEQHRDGTKNTCSNAPAAVACLRLAAFSPEARAAELRLTADKIVRWTAANLQTDDGLFADRMVVATGRVIPGKLTYNSALMIRAMLGMYRCTADKRYLREAVRTGEAADWFVCRRTHAYFDSLKWSHLMVEADLDLYRATKDDRFMRRAIDNGNYWFERFKEHPATTLIDNAALARMLWLIADAQTAVGRSFWKAADEREAAAASPRQNVTPDQ
jgi:hypothetical protein